MPRDQVVNHSCPSTVDERAIVLRPSSVYQRHENLTLALTSAQVAVVAVLVAVRGVVVVAWCTMVVVEWWC